MSYPPRSTKSWELRSKAVRLRPSALLKLEGDALEAVEPIESALMLYSAMAPGVATEEISLHRVNLRTALLAHSDKEESDVQPMIDAWWKALKAQAQQVRLEARGL